MSDQIKEAIAAAEAKAAEASSAVANVAPNTIDANTVTTKLTVDDALDDKSGAVDGYFKVKTTGMAVGGKKVESFSGRMRVSDQVVNKTVRYGPNDNLTYVKSYDGRFAEDGTPWNTVKERASKLMNKRIQDYTSYDMVVLLNETIGDEMEGTPIGYSTPYTAKRTVDTLIKEARAAGIPDDEYFDVTLSYITKESKQGSDYAILQGTFDGASELD